MRSA
jgi:hypothetical protein